MVKINELKVSHILISPPEKIIYLACRDRNQRVHLYCIYDKKLVKSYEGRWKVLNQIFSQKVIQLAERNLYRIPTFETNNISREFVN